MTKDRYEIPLHSFDEGDEKTGPYVIIEPGDISLIDYRGDPPHDLVPLYRYEAFNLVQVVMTWLVSETKVRGLLREKYGDYRDGHSEADDDSDIS